MMTQDEIIEITREAGGFDATPEFLERFAKLVAAKEREACLNLADSLGWVNVDHIRARGQA
jgi:hypothetical protein